MPNSGYDTGIETPIRRPSPNRLWLRDEPETARDEAMLTTLILMPLLLQGSQIQAEGLKSGERILELARETRLPEDARDPGLLCAGRVLDAFTGRPLASARIQVWTEEIDAVAKGYFRIDEAMSGRDGRFLVSRRMGAIEGEKGRISLPGYLTLSCTAGDLDGPIALYPASKSSPSLRILDMDGRPVAGALVTSTYTCAHDVPAFHVRSDGEGIARLPAFGLQADVQELRVQAKGFAPIKYLDAEDSFRFAGAGPQLVYLTRSTPTAFRVVDRKGVAMFGRAIYVVEGDFYHVLRSNRLGICTLLSRHGWRPILLNVLEHPQNDFLTELLPVFGRVPTVRPFAEDWEEGIALGKLILRFKEEPGTELDYPVQVLHGEGYLLAIDRVPEGPVEFPAGRGMLVVGAPFQGAAQRVQDFELEKGKSVELKLRVSKETRMRFEIARAENIDVTLEVSGNTRRELPTRMDITVPRGGRLKLLIAGKGFTLRKILPPAQDGQSISLDEIVDAAREKAAKSAAALLATRATQVLRFVDGESGGTLTGKLDLDGLQGCEVSKANDGTLQVSGPKGHAFLASFRAAGHVKVWVRGYLGAQEESIVRRVPRTARLAIEAPFKFEIEGEDALELDSLAPGPLELVLRSEDGRRFSISLELRPGETRKLRLRHI